MKIKVALLLFLLTLPAYADIERGTMSSITEEDGSPEAYPYMLKVPNSSLTDNLDGTASISTSVGDAPSTADYLVGTANGSLSAEIVVGTTPGGELGGTWASPTIDDSVTVTGWALGTSSATSFDATTLTEGTNAVYNSTEVPGGELGGTWASPTIDDNVAVTSWNLTTPAIGAATGTSLNVTGGGLTVSTNGQTITYPIGAGINTTLGNGYGMTLPAGTDNLIALRLTNPGVGVGSQLQYAFDGTGTGSGMVFDYGNTRIGIYRNGVVYAYWNVDAAGNTGQFGKINLYNNIACEDYGLPAIVDGVSLINQVADIASTNATNCNVAGVYRVNYYLVDTTADATAGAVTLTLAWTDRGGAKTLNSTAVLLTATTSYTQGVIYIQLSSGSIAYSTTHTGLYGNAKYALFMDFERLS